MNMKRGGLAAALLLFFAAPLQAQCVGDCDGSGTIGANEVVTGVAVALGVQPPEVCPAFPPCDIAPVCVSDLIRAVGQALTMCEAPLELPQLAGSDPADAAEGVSPASWIRLDFAVPFDPRLPARIALRCGGSALSLTVTALDAQTLLLDPRGTGLLPAASECEIAMPGASLRFRTADGAAAETVLYDRDDRRRLVPFPDDAFRAADNEGGALAVPLPEGPSDLQQLFGGLLAGSEAYDGFSPLAPWIVELSAAPDPATLPLTPAASLAPLATVQLFDVTPDAPEYGQRVPFRLEPRTDTSVVGGLTSHSLLLFPSIPLQPRHRYGLVVTRRVHSATGVPFAPSAFLAQCLAGDASIACRRARGSALRALPAAPLGGPPLEIEDAALALSATIRSTAGIAADQTAIRHQLAAAAPPAWAITSVAPGTTPDVAAIVRGTWQAPDWRDGLYFARDAGGVPQPGAPRAVPFVLALPAAALAGPVPIVMYQHGNPGSAENEVPSAARRSLAGEGFAVAGFTDILNRELSAGISDRDQAILAQVAPVLQAILEDGRIPDFWAETRAEQLAFLRFLEGLGDLDLLPLGAPDGVPELDVGAPRLYLGISEGANNGPGLLPYAPEIRAAALVAGGARLAEVLIHQGAALFLNTLGAVFPSLTPTEIWLGVSLFQLRYDDQDAHNHAPFLYRQPVDVGSDARRASVLLIEGLDDSLVPNHATDSLAWSLGPLPHLGPVQRAVPFLAAAAAPLQGNVSADTTAAFYQYVPTGIPGIDPTPGCVVLPPASGGEGHYCPQSAAESFLQRAVFFHSAVAGTPLLIDPLTE